MRKPKQESMTTQESNASEVVGEFATYNIYLAEVRRLLIGKGLGSAWVDELIERDDHFLDREFKSNRLPVYAAFELHITEEESARDPIPEDRRLKMDVSDQAMIYLEQLVKMGLWGGTAEAVAANLINQQLASKLEAGLFRGK